MKTYGNALNVPHFSGDPASPVDGDVWYNDTADELRARINGATVALGAGGGGGASYAIIADHKGQFTQGGTFTSGADRTRDLNTEVSDVDGIVTLSSNRFSLAAGTYVIEWAAPAFQVGWHQSKLYDYTNSADVSFGASAYGSTSVSVQTNSVGMAIVSPGSTTEYEIRHVGNSTKSTEGFGQGNNGLWATNVYTQVCITKIA